MALDPKPEYPQHIFSMYKYQMDLITADEPETWK